MKSLVICCDGTWNRADSTTDAEQHNATNVLRFAYLTAKRDADGNPQILFYDQGVGTGNRVDRLTGGAFGRGLDDNIFDAYRFLIANYEEGDRIYLVGFSRGAFTARSLAGLIRTCGILKREAVDHYVEALRRYREREGDPDSEELRAIRSGCSIAGDGKVPIHFIGVWDTVGSLGIPLRGLRGLTRRRYRFHDTELSGSVAHAYHALAIDERRAPFEPMLWSSEPKGKQVLEQVWFAGVHSDVGGGYQERGNSDVSLGWMLEKAEAAGLATDRSSPLRKLIAPQPLADLHDSKRGFYRVTPGIDRPIGLRPADPGEPKGATVEDTRQSLHPSVRSRWDADSSYRPPSLREYFARTRDPRATA